MSRLIGAPPGYVGYDEGGQLTEAVRRKPYSVVLLDEIEKAHPDVFNILLQVLDEGRLTDNKGRVANFRNTLVIMTSNMGSNLIMERFSEITEANKFQVYEDTRAELMQLLRQTVRPEFLNRIDESIMFLPLEKKDLMQIVRLQLNRVKKQLADQQITLEATDAAVQYLADVGYDPQYGGRPVKRVIQKRVLNELSKKILSGEIHKDEVILLDLDEQESLVFNNATIDLDLD